LDLHSIFPNIKMYYIELKNEKQLNHFIDKAALNNKHITLLYPENHPTPNNDFAKKCKNLSGLSLKNTLVTSIQCTKLLKNNPKLQHLYLNSSITNEIGPSLATLKKLESLQFSTNVNITSAIGPYLPKNLKNLDLSNCYKVKD